MTALYEKEAGFWKERFDAEDSLTVLPYSQSSNHFSLEPHCYNSSLPSELSQKIVSLANGSPRALFMILLAGVNCLIHKYINAETIIVGMPVVKKTNETRLSVNDIVLLKDKIGADTTFKTLLNQIKSSLNEAISHQNVPFQWMTQHLHIQQNVEGLPIIPVLISFDDIHGDDIGTSIVSDVHFQFFKEQDGLRLNLLYQNSRYSKEFILQIVAHLFRIFAEVLLQPDLPIQQIDPISESEKVQILDEFNDTTADYAQEATIYGLFEEQVERTPDQTAVVCTNRSMTYRELNERANQLARTLRSAGVQVDQPVAIMAERSLEMIVGIYAILKAGGAYVPIDPDYPQERIQYILEDSGAKLLLTQRHLKEQSAFVGTIIDLDDASVYDQDSSNLDPLAGAGDMAYVIYTSGSTGNPKGVMVEHRPVINRLMWMQEAYPIASNDTILQKTAITFDVSVWELFWWAFVGAKMCLLPPGGEKNPEVIWNTIEEQGITTMHFVPSMLHAFLEFVEGQPESEQASKLRTLRQVFASGEALAPTHVARFHRLITPVNDARLINLYGPTEATVDVSYFNCEEDQAYTSVPIGKPISNIQLFMIASGSMQLQPVGVPGELCIAGDGLARGYLNRPELTAEKFVDHPFKTGKRMYRTGDLAKWLPDGNIEYLGRIDHQVKIRGYRIEVGEVEAQLLKVTSVQEAVVIAREDDAGEKHLCAYFTATQTLTTGDLRSILSAVLPGYMIPSYFVQLEQMPLSPNGKLDRKALPAPQGNILSRAEYTAPRTTFEVLLAQIWQDVLGIQQIGVRDHFFDLGGHSIKVLRLVQKILTDTGVNLPLHRIFEMPVLEDMARELLKYRLEQDSGSESIMKLNESGLLSVFCFPPAAGYGLAYYELAKRLENDCVLYGFDFIEDSPSYEEMLDQYVDKIISVQTQQPYVFLGYSLGGCLAFEVAKSMEKRGYTVSDIIMLDASFRAESTDFAPEIVEDQVNQMLNDAADPYKQFLTEPHMREKIRNKILAYVMYGNQLVNTGVVQANIHGLAAGCIEAGKVSTAEILLWKQATSNKYVEFEAVGKHQDLLEADFIDENAEVIRRIVSTIVKNHVDNYSLLPG